MIRLAGLALLGVVWGTQFLVIKAGLATLPPLLTLALRYLVLLVVAQAAVWVTRTQAPPGVGLRRVGFGCSQTVSMALLYWAQGHLASSLAGVLLGTTPFMVAALAHLYIPGDRLKGWSAASTGLGFCGAALIAIKGGSGADLNAPAVAVAAFLYLGLVASAAASGLYLVLLRHYSVSGLAYLQFVTAAVAVVAGVGLAQEQLSPTVAAGVCLVLVGLVMRSHGLKRKVL